MAKNLGALAALAALGYMASRGGEKADSTAVAPQSMDSTSMDAEREVGSNSSEPESMPEPKAIPKKVSAPAAPSTKSVASAGGRDGAGQMADYKMRKARDLEAGNSRGTRPATAPTAKAPMSNYSNEGRGRELTKKQQVENVIDSARPSAEQTQKGLETASTMMGGAGLKAIGSAAKDLANRGASPTRTAAQQAWDRSQMAERLTPVRGASSKAAEESAREAKTLNPMAWMAGPKGMADNFKRGGAVKKMASGGMTSMPSSSASRRGDGIASKGKTRGKIY